MKRSQSLLLLFIRNTHPWELFLGILMFAMGAGIVQYLGRPVNWTVYMLGQAWVILVQMSCYFLKAHFDCLERTDEEPKHRSADEEFSLPLEIERRALLQAGMSTLCVAAVITFLLYIEQAINPVSLLFLTIIFSLAFGYAIPPLRLVNSGYGELLVSIYVANLVPALAFTLQTGELHRVLAMLTFPFTALYLAISIARSLQGYASDIKYFRKTLLTRLGWQRGMNFHNLLIAATYFLFCISIIQGLPWILVSPGLLTLPIGIFQIWLLGQIAIGARPRWKLLSLTSFALVILTAYLITFTLWTG